VLEGKAMTSLVNEEAQWHVQQVQKAKVSGKKVILFSHHEPITFNGSIGLKKCKQYPANDHLYRQLHDCIPSVDAYFFGHQHQFMLYQDYHYRDGQVLQKPRLIGHGGCPVIAMNVQDIYKPELKYDTDAAASIILLP
jgi:hypothetical protein